LSADFNHPLSYERPFKFLRHLVGPLEIDDLIAISAINIHLGDGRSSVGLSARYTLLCCGFDSRCHTQILYKENRKMLFGAQKTKEKKINIHSAIFKFKQHGNGHRNRNGHGNRN
jgi:hypothetical protein